MSPRPDPTETRAALLDAALRCFQRTGYHRTSMDDVVRESGLSKGTLYWHFTNKQDLFLTLFDELMRQIIGQFARPDPALPAAAQLETLLASSAQLITHDSPLRGLPLNFLMELWQEEVFWGRYQAAIEPFQTLVQTIIEAGIASGEFRPVDSKALSWALIAQYDGLMLYALTGLSADINAQVAALNELVLAGLRRKV